MPPIPCLCPGRRPRPRRPFCSELAAVGKIIDDDELVGYILNGLDGSYNALVASVNGNPGTTVSDLSSQLSSYDMRRDMLAASGQADTETFVSSANVARLQDRHKDGDHPPAPPHRDGGGGRYDGGGGDRRRNNGGGDRNRGDRRGDRGDRRNDGSALRRS